MQRFKIDFIASKYTPYGLYFKRPCWHRRLTGLMWWEEVERFETHETAKAYYDKIKGLPEYLD